MPIIGKNPFPTDTVSFHHTNRVYQLKLPNLIETIERRNLIIRQLALKPKKALLPKEKTLNQIILSTPPSELKEVLKKMGLLA